jgi:hypothetical protein
MANPTSNFNWQMPTPTDLVTDLPADFEVFGQAVDSSMADLLGGTTGQILAKNSNTNMDFVWITNDVGDITAVTAGTGISGGGSSGAVTITNSMATEIAAKGDLIAGTGSQTFDNLTVGANGSVLTPDSSAATGLKWSLYPKIVGSSIYGSGLTIANNTSTIATFPDERFDTAGFHSTTTNTGRFTIPTGYAGWYVINARFRWDKSAGGSRSLIVKKNGNTLSASSEIPGDATIFQGNQINTLELFAVGDYVEIEVFQSSGGNLTLFTDTSNAEFSIVMVGV